MTSIYYKLALILFFVLFLNSCSKKSDQDLQETEGLSQEDIELLEEMPDLESVEEAGAEGDEEEESEDYIEDPEEEVEIEEKAKPEQPVQNVTFTKSAPKPASAANSGKYVVQVGVYGDMGMANNTVQKLKNQGFNAYHTAVESPVENMPGTHYRVRVGYFGSIEEADAYARSELVPKNYKYWVDLKRNDARTSGTVKKKKSPEKKSPKKLAKKTVPKKEKKLKKKFIKAPEKKVTKKTTKFSKFKSKPKPKPKEPEEEENWDIDEEDWEVNE